jgi:hypothetical protein
VSGAVAAARDADTTTSYTGYRNITQPSDRTTSTPSAGPGADLTATPDRTPLGAESPLTGVLAAL